MTRNKIETKRIFINSFDDLVRFSINLLGEVEDFSQYSKTIAFLSEVREEYRFWMGEHFKLELKCKIEKFKPHRFVRFHVVLPKRKEAKKQ